MKVLYHHSNLKYEKPAGSGTYMKGNTEKAKIAPATISAPMILRIRMIRIGLSRWTVSFSSSLRNACVRPARMTIIAPASIAYTVDEKSSTLNGAEKST